LGELTDDIFFAKIDNDKEADLAKSYQIDGLPTLFLEQYVSY
jgi:hypothetical protein